MSAAAIEDKTDQAERLRLELNNSQIQCATTQTAYEKALTDHAEHYAGILNALVLACLAVMVIETLIDPAATGYFLRLRGSLAGVRYACMAAWSALMIAQPPPATPLLLVALILAVGLAVALLPLRRAVLAN